MRPTLFDWLLFALVLAVAGWSIINSLAFVYLWWEFPRGY